MASDSKPELVYFDGRGRGEIIRLVFAASEIEFTEKYLRTREDFLAVESDLPFGQVPLLRIDGQNVVQTQAIVRHIARKGHLLGEKEPEMTKIDTVYEGSRDLFAIFLAIGFVLPFENVKDKKPAIERFLKVFEKILKENGSTGYFVGSHLTLADVGVLEGVLATVDYFGLEFLNEYPEILKFYNTVTSLEKIAKYIKEIRKRRNDPHYISEVKASLAF